MEDKLNTEKPKTFKELFKGTGIEPKEDSNGNITWSFKVIKK
jgi:hypothetical protein